VTPDSSKRWAPAWPNALTPQHRKGVQYETIALSNESPTDPIDWVIPMRSQHALKSLLVY
jgi:hypothetical protein